MLTAIAALAGRFPVLEMELRAAQDRLGERPRLLRQRLPPRPAGPAPSSARSAFRAKMISRFVISPTPPKEDAPTSRPKQAPLGPKGPKKRAPQNP